MSRVKKGTKLCLQYAVRKNHTIIKLQLLFFFFPKRLNRNVICSHNSLQPVHPFTLKVFTIPQEKKNQPTVYCTSEESGLQRSPMHVSRE